LITQFFALIVGLSIFGYTRDFLGGILEPALIDATTSYSSILIVLSAIFFYIRFWKEYKPHKIFVSILWGMLLIAACNAALLLHGETRLALSINMFLIFLIPFITFAMVFSASGWNAQDPEERPLVPKWIITTYFGVNLVILLAGALPGLGVLEGGAYSIYVGLMHGIINGAFAVSILQYRSYLLSQKRAHLAIDLAIARQEVDQERSFREERERLLAMLGHELKTPLATVRMLLGRDELDASTVGQIKRSVREMNAVIERSVQVNQLDDARITTDMKPVDLVNEIKEISDLIEAAAGSVQVTGPSSLVIQSDRQLMRIVFSNLLDNAVKYREQGSRVDVVIAAKQDGSWAEVSIENQPGSAGFPDANKLFTKYYRSPMAHRQTGSGLGMYLVKGLLKALKGTIEYKPTNDKVRFQVCLPVSLS
jgi:signal transduction histidine kinase